MLNISKSELTLEPFLRWAGGKRWLINKEEELSPKTYNTYLEPFLGSAAVFFSKPIKSFIISDLNSELINCYKSIKNNHKEIESLVQEHHVKHSKDYYYEVRSTEYADDISRAARFLYLNQTCFNGLYRVNKQGKFNVPVGTIKNEVKEINLSLVARKLEGGEILNQDFENTIQMARKNDFIFIDPPYTVNHNLNGFLEYNEKIFSWEDQVRLKNSVLAASARGVMITMTNADHQSIRELYEDEDICDIQKIERYSGIAGKAANRKVTSELILRFGWKKIL